MTPPSQYIIPPNGEHGELLMVLTHKAQVYAQISMLHPCSGYTPVEPTIPDDIWDVQEGTFKNLWGDFYPQGTGRYSFPNADVRVFMTSGQPPPSTYQSTHPFFPSTSGYVNGFFPANAIGAPSPDPEKWHNPVFLETSAQYDPATISLGGDGDLVYYDFFLQESRHWAGVGPKEIDLYQWTGPGAYATYEYDPNMTGDWRLWTMRPFQNHLELYYSIVVYPPWHPFPELRGQPRVFNRNIQGYSVWHLQISYEEYLYTQYSRVTPRYTSITVPVSCLLLGGAMLLSGSVGVGSGVGRRQRKLT
jgi:hypothetical protein